MKMNSSKLFRQVMSMVLCFVMVLSLMPMAVMAEEAVEGPPIPVLYVGTVNALETPSGDGWSFNGETGVLTLNNCTLTESMLHVETDEYGSDRFAAKNIAQAVHVAAVYSDGTTTWTSGVLGYSIGAYCVSQATKGGTIADLAMTAAVYGYHAKQYFG